MVPSPDLLHSSSVHDEEASIYSTIRARKDQHSGDHKVVSSITACLLLNDLDIGILPAEFGSHPIFASVAELDLSG